MVQIPRGTVVRTLASHEVVQSYYPRVTTDRDELGMAIGSAIDRSLAQYSHQFAQGRHPTVTAMNRLARGILEELLSDAHLEIAPTETEKIHVQIAAVIAAFRKSEVFGLPRPRTRLILINGHVGVYAQPDFWDGRGRIYEMKSYQAFPPGREVSMQLGLFQLAYPGFEEILACFNRHSTPVRAELTRIPPQPPAASELLLRQAYGSGLRLGLEKILEYIDLPIVSYTVPMEDSAPGTLPPPGRTLEHPP
ncbi:MAG: hypothetical protein ACYDFT_02760 [Thermoplasmata archaeon]